MQNSALRELRRTGEGTLTFSSAAAYSKSYPYLSWDAKGKSSEEMRMKRILDKAAVIYLSAKGKQI
jgi:hypothetical protein